MDVLRRINMTLYVCVKKDSNNNKTGLNIHQLKFSIKFYIKDYVHKNHVYCHNIVGINIAAHSYILYEQRVLSYVRIYISNK